MSVEPAKPMYVGITGPDVFTGSPPTMTCGGGELVRFRGSQLHALICSGATGVTSVAMPLGPVEAHVTTLGS